MACNCKKGVQMEDKYGVKEDESFLVKLPRFAFKTLVFLITLVLAIVVTPIMILFVLYKLFFAKNREIILPKKLRKFIE
jgi:hypothetical protein